MDGAVNGPYRTCEEHCNHDLARGIGVADLLTADGPYPPSYLIVNFSLQRAAVFGGATQPTLLDDEQAPLRARQAS